MTPIATGSDAGGSLRIPAAACGVYGFKPTFGLVPDDGRPSAFGRELQHTTKGPMTRTVEDAALLLSVMDGPHPADPNSVPVEIDYQGALERPIDDYRIAYSPDLDVFPVADEVRAVVDETVSALADAGATVEEISVDHGYYDGRVERGRDAGVHDLRPRVGDDRRGSPRRRLSGPIRRGLR